jgi:hypothetical protein
VIPQLVALHLGGLHPYEKVLTFGLAFGPFLILLAVIWVRHRQDQVADETERSAQDQQEISGGSATPDLSEPPSSRP